VNKTLFRHRTDKMIGGVAGGIAEFLDQDPTVVRVVIAVLALLSSGGVLMAYLVAWVLMPEGPPSEDGSLGPSYLEQWSTKERTAPQPPTGEPSHASQQPMVQPAPPERPSASSRQGTVSSSPATGARWLGFALIAVGVVALAERYLPRFDVWELWPVVIIVIGLATIIGRRGE
jgi:phage shock protein PspC (stress-responsive transcriptional regulator)